MLKPPVADPLLRPFSLYEVQCIWRKGYLHYLTVQLFAGLLIGEANARKEAHHG